MKKAINISKKLDDKTFISDYEKIVNSSEDSVIIKTEWINKGDHFKKLSIYDNSYSPIYSLGNTTLIKNIIS